MRKSIFLVFSLCLCLCFCCGIYLAESENFVAEYTQISLSNTNFDSISNLHYKEKLFFSTKQGANNYIHLKDNETEKTYNLGNIIPYDFALLDENTLVITSSNYFIYLLNLENEQLITIDDYIDSDNSLWSVPAKNRKLAISATQNIYFIWDNVLATLQKTDDNYYLKFLTNLTYNGTDLNFVDGGFFINEKGSKIFFSITSTIYSYDTQSRAISKTEFSGIEFLTISSITEDNLGNLYILDQEKLYKINQNESFYTTFDSDKYQISIDLESGYIYGLKNDTLYKIHITNNFISDLKSQTHPVEISSLTPMEQIVKVVNTQNSNLYTYKSLSKITTSYTESKNLIVLDESDSDFYFVLDNNSTTSSSGFLLGYILKSECTVLSSSFPSEFKNKTARVIVSSTKIYTLPFSLNITTNTKAPSFAKLNYGQNPQIVASPILPIDSNQASFVAVKYVTSNSTFYGYVDSRTLIDTEQESLTPIPVANAELRAETFVYTNEDLTTQLEKLTKSTPIRVLSTKNGVCKIQYFVNLENEQTVKTAYVKSSFVNDGSLNFTQILGIVLMVVSIVVAIIVAIVIKRHKRKVENE